jgi:hypothetical protein
LTGGGGATVGLSGQGYDDHGIGCPNLSLNTTPTGGLHGSRGDLALLGLFSAILFVVGKRSTRGRVRVR